MYYFVLVICSLCLVYVDPCAVNHHLANKRRIKEIQIKSYQQQQQTSIVPSPPRPSTRYSHIQSKVTTRSSVSELH